MLKYFWTKTQMEEIIDTCKQYQLPIEVEERMIS